MKCYNIARSSGQLSFKFEDFGELSRAVSSFKLETEFAGSETGAPGRGFFSVGAMVPTAHAVGYLLSPLRGWAPAQIRRFSAMETVAVIGLNRDKST